MIKFDRSVTECTQDLPPKWDAFFKQIIKQYDLKQYEKALKSVEEMLKVYPTHAETIAIKGIVLTNVEKTLWKEDVPLLLLKEAVKLRVKSPFCWHMLGRLHIQEKCYLEAMKCYRMVVKLDPANISVTLDLAKLETQLREFSSLVKTRKVLLSLRPSDSFSWVCLAVAHDLNGEHEIALQLLDECANMPDRELSHTEHHERALYHVRLLMKASKYRRVLEMLPVLRQVIQSESKLRFIEAECLLKLGHNIEAADIYHRILSTESDLAALQGYVSAKVNFPFEGNFDNKALSREQKDEIFDVLVRLNNTSLAMHIALRIADESQFLQRLQGFLEPYVSLNITAVLNVLKPFYGDDLRETSIEKCLISWCSREEAISKEDEKSNPTRVLWLYVMLAQHYIRVGDPVSADAYLEKAKAHTPTAEILTFIEARIEKKRGNNEALLQALKRGTEIGLKDRYASNRYVKHLLRCHKIEEAEAVFRSFNNIQESNFLKHISDIQCIWYELELADSFYQQGDVLSALQMYLMVNKHFDEFAESEYDFHGYCLQRGTLCAYIDVIQNNTNRKQHPSCVSAAEGIVRCLIDVNDMNNIEVLQSRRTTYGKAISDNPFAVPLPNLKIGLINALEYVRLLEKYSSQNSPSLALSGIVYFKLNKSDMALKMLNKAIEASENGLTSDTNALYNLLASSHESPIEEARGLISKMQLA